MTEAFAKHLRLNQSHQFKSVFSAKKKINVNGFAVFYKPNDLPYPRLGMIVARKQIQKAVWRNQIKRSIRESFRKNQHRLIGMDIVILCRNQLLTLSKVELNQCIDKLWQKLATHAGKSC